mmetsp:Transcript_24499/g.70620  ORF Transcript_24499/g.70620 Transcript_24499/m.70620 type:complete len:326 (-) Transcript_24499:226-1203(-)
METIHPILHATPRVTGRDWRFAIGGLARSDNAARVAIGHCCLLELIGTRLLVGVAATLSMSLARACDRAGFRVVISQNDRTVERKRTNGIPRGRPCIAQCSLCRRSRRSCTHRTGSDARASSADRGLGHGPIPIEEEPKVGIGSNEIVKSRADLLVDILCIQAEGIKRVEIVATSSMPSSAVIVNKHSLGRRRRDRRTARSRGGSTAAGAVPGPAISPTLRTAANLSSYRSRCRRRALRCRCRTVVSLGKDGLRPSRGLPGLLHRLTHLPPRSGRTGAGPGGIGVGRRPRNDRCGVIVGAPDTSGGGSSPPSCFRHGQKRAPGRR